MLELNKIYNMDCLEGMKLIEDKSIDLILTDPPYNISNEQNIKMKNHPTDTNRRRITTDFGKWDKFKNEQDFLKFTENWMKECYRILKDNGNFISFFNSWYTGNLKKIWKSFGGDAPSQKLYWIKSNPKPQIRKVNFMNGVEEIFWGYKLKSGHKFNYQLGQHHNYIISAVFYNSEISGHPTQKPENTVDWIIKYLSNENDIVFDPFAGSGTIPAVSCYLKRKFIGFEINKEYFEKSNIRIQNHNNQMRF